MRKLRRILVVVLFVVGVIAPVAQSAEAKQKVLGLVSKGAFDAHGVFCPLPCIDSRKMALR